MNWYFEVFRKYADFDGRASRSEYWWFFLMSIIVSSLLSTIDAITGTFNPDYGIGLLSAVYSLAVFIPSFAVNIRRLHDIGRSGWWLFLHLIPLLGTLVLLFWSIKASDPNENQYGITATLPRN
jgi:uncharacterized membrane protein YhaH (DUF805 family)